MHPRLFSPDCETKDSADGNENAPSCGRLPSLKELIPDKSSVVTRDLYEGLVSNCVYGELNGGLSFLFKFGLLSAF